MFTKWQYPTAFLPLLESSEASQAFNINLCDAKPRSSDPKMQWKLWSSLDSLCAADGQTEEKYNHDFLPLPIGAFLVQHDSL